MVYTTSNLNLMAYVRRCGLKYLKSVTEQNHGKTRVVAHFDDPDKIGETLEMDWHESNDKTFQDWRIFFRNEIDKTLRGK